MSRAVPVTETDDAVQGVPMEPIGADAVGWGNDALEGTHQHRELALSEDHLEDRLLNPVAVSFACFRNGSQAAASLLICRVDVVGD